MGYYDRAIDFLNDACELEPGDYEALALMGAVLTEMGLYRRALRCFRESMQSHPTAEVLSMIGYVLALTGRRRRAMQIIDELESYSEGAENHPLKRARIHLALGEKEIAVRLLNEAFDRHEIDLYGITYDPRLGSIKNDRRFIEFIERIGFSRDMIAETRRLN